MANHGGSFSGLTIAGFIASKWWNNTGEGVVLDIGLASSAQSSAGSSST